MAVKVEISKEARSSYPDWMIPVTGGKGGDSLLILGDEKTALFDCGMSYCSDILLTNIEKALDGRKLDYILISHSHYDHVGALPQVRNKYPEAIVAGGYYCTRVFESEGALKTIELLGKEAAKMYGHNPDVVTTDNMQITMQLSEGDSISLGNRSLRVLETPGHTRCSISFYIEPENILLASESVGVLLPTTCEYQPLILKSYVETIKTIEKCIKLGSSSLVCPHFGMVPEDMVDSFWETAWNSSIAEKEFVVGLLQSGLSVEDAIERYREKYFVEGRATEQPIEAFYANAIPTVRMYAKEFGNN